MKKILFFILVTLAIVLMYYLAVDKRIYYVSLGDFLSVGVTDNKSSSFGYADHLKDLLRQTKDIKYYTKEFANRDYRIIDLINDINNNKTINNLTIQQSLDKANVITISIGNNDIFYKMGINDMNYNLSTTADTYSYIKEVINDYDKLLKVIKKYSHCQVYITGFYNPLSNLSTVYARELEPVFMYANEALMNLTKTYGYTYIDIYSLFKDNSDFIPNKTVVFPSNNAYQAIAKEIYSKIIN